MQRYLIALLVLIASVILWAHQANSQDSKQALVLDIKGAIGPGTTLYLTRGFEQAAEQQASLVIVRIDTPGGLDAATRDIAQAIIASPVPVALYVAPSGARAASAGTYILYSAHIAAMAPSTSLGAATPVQIGGSGFGEQPSDTNEKGSSNDSEEQTQPSNNSSTAMERKVVNDAVAFIRGLAELRGRNADWAEDAVRNAVSLTASDALEQNVIDLIATDIPDLLAQIDGRKVNVMGVDKTLDTKNLSIKVISPDWRSELLSIITDPSVAYFLMLAGIYGLIFEGYNPGGLVPGVVGAICLITALYAFQVLPVNYAGFAMIALGLILMIAEAMAPSFGVLGIVGVIALTIGSIFLMDSDVPGLQISRSLIAAVAIITGSAFLVVLIMAGKTLRMKRIPSRESMIGLQAEVLYDFTGEGQVRLHGEIWRAISSEPVKAGQYVTIEQQNGLTLHVQPTHNH